MNAPKALVAVVLASAAVLGLGGCAAESDAAATPPCEAYETGVVLVVGAHANQPVPDLTAEIACRLEQTIVVGEQIGIVAVDGAPWVYSTLKPYPVTGENDAAKSNSIRGSLGDIVGLVHAAAPRTNGSDLLNGLILAAEVAGSAKEPVRDLVVIDSGLSDTGLDLTVPGGTVVVGDEVAAHLFATHALNPDQFSNLRVEFWSLAETRSPQGELSLRQKDAITALWPGIVSAAGGTGTAVTFPRTGDAMATEFTVHTAEVVDPEPYKPAAGDVLSFDGASELAFHENVSVLMDPEAARAGLAPVAAWLAADPSRHAEVVGRTSSADPVLNETLAPQRAQVVADILIELGASPSQLTVTGAGYTADPPDRLADGTLDPIAAALNRVTEIHLS